MPSFPLPRPVVAGQAGHAKLHTDEIDALNDLDARLVDQAATAVKSTDARLPQPVYPSAEYVDKTTDQDGRMAMGVRADGSVEIPVIHARKVNGVETATTYDPRYVEVVTDQAGRIVYAIGTDGKVYIPQLVGAPVAPAAPSRTPEPAWSTKLRYWDPRLAAYNLHPRSLRKWTAALARAAAGGAPAHVTTHIDSRTYGAAATGVTVPKWRNSWPGRLRRLLDAHTGYLAGTGLAPIWDTYFTSPGDDPRFTLGSAVTSRTNYGGARDGYGPLRVACAILDNSASNGWVQFAPPNVVNGFTAWFAARDGATGLATIKVDGNSVGTVSLAPVASGGTLARRAGTPTNVIAVDVTGLVAGAHTLRIEGPAGELCDLIMVEGHAATGVRVSNLARSSTQMGDLVATDANNRYGLTWSVDLPKADLAILMPISNDRTAGKAAFKAQVQTFIERQQATGGDVLLVAPVEPDYPTLGGTSANWRDLVTALYELADTYDVPLLDHTWSWVDFAGANARGLMGDGIHENNDGSERIARNIFAAVTTTN